MVKSFLFAITTIVLLSIITSNQINKSGEDSSIKSNELKLRDVLVFIFPGGKSHNFVFRNLFEYTNKRAMKEEKDFKYIFHILVHNFDISIWENSGHKIYGYGDENSYKEKFFDAMEEAKNDPIMGYMGFNNAMKHLYNEFLNEKGLLELLKKINFEVIISDITNLLTIFLSKELNIEKKIYVNPTCIFTWLNTLMEYNPGYTPSIGISFTEDMNFWGRFTNFFLVHGTNLFYDFFNKDQNTVFHQNGYQEAINPFEKRALYMNQCVEGFHYSIPLPSNFINLGAILPKPAQKLEHLTILKFMENFKKIVYVSQGTITKVFRLEMFLKTFADFSEVGFIMSKNNLFELSSLGNVPENVLILDWVPQNDLLGNEKVKAFITHGGLNSILESLYHGKPMIAIGFNIDQTNGAIAVEYRKAGISITEESKLSKENLQNSLKQILEDSVYQENCQMISRYVKIKDGKEIFYFWLNYVFEVGYEHLLVKSYLNHNHFQKYNVDIMLFILFVICLVLYTAKKIFFWIFKV